MTDTRHLDKSIAILKGGKRTKRKNTISLIDLGTDGVSVQVNGREVWLAPDIHRAREDAKYRKERAAALGRVFTVEES